MRCLSRNDLEQIGERVVRSYRKLPEFNGKTIYSIMPSVLIEKVLKLKMEYHHLSLDGLVLGVTTSYSDIGYRVFDIRDEEQYIYFDGKTVLIERDLKDDIALQGRLHYTEAHEAGHQVLSMLFPEDYNASPQKLHFCMAEPVRNEINWKEWQADTLASVLLMPKDIVKQTLFLFGFGETIPRINRVYSSEDYRRFSMMAELLGVSKQALSIRLSQLGLVERNDFDDPYSIIDVFNYGGM